MPRDLDLGAGRIVPGACLDMRFARSGGPGGQHVNKTETKVDLRCDLEKALPVLGEEAVARLRDKLANRLDADGRVLVVCEETRSRHRNVELAIVRMETILRAALVRPKPRKKTRPTRGSQLRRLEGKKRRGDIKRGRSGDHD